MTKKGKIITWTSVSAILLLSLFVFIKFFFPYGEGVDEGDIIYFQKEGFVFKTYEGKMIQTGFKNAKVQGSLHSNEFKFSVVDERVARQLIESAIWVLCHGEVTANMWWIVFLWRHGIIGWKILCMTTIFQLWQIEKSYRK